MNILCGLFYMFYVLIFSKITIGYAFQHEVEIKLSDNEWVY